MTYVNSCAVHGKFEWHAPRFTTPDPPCPKCGGATERTISAPAVIWSKPLVDYGDRNKESWTKDQKMGGHVMFRKNSGRALETGVPEAVMIRSQAEQRQFCRDEGLVPPSDVPNNISVAADGHSFETTNRCEI